MAEEVKKKGKNKNGMYYVHVAIGLAIMAIFWVAPAADPITPLGMKVLGVFLGMVYLWSAVDVMWPSILGLFLLGASGLGGDAGSNGVWLNAVGNYTVLLILFAMVLFGAFDVVGGTKYIAKWFLTKKVFAGRPYVFMAIFFACCFVLSALTSPIISLIIVWPIAKRVCQTMNITREDKLWKFFFIGVFLVSTLAQPFFPFKGAALIPVSAFQTMTTNMGNAMQIPFVPYMLTDLIMTILVMGIYLLAMKVMKVDVEKMKDIHPDMIEKTMPLPAMTTQQKCYMWMVPIYLVLVLGPSFVKGNPVSDFLNYIGILGTTAGIVVVFLMVRIDGEPLLDFKEVAYKRFNWGIFFMIAAAVYAANALSNSSTGISTWLVQVLNPLLGGQPEMVFVALMLAVALLITNFANNAAMAVVLTPVVISFSNQLGINPVPVEMGVILMVFVAMLTPAASPHAAMMYGNREIYSPKDIISIGLPMCLVTLVCYIFIGYPMIKGLVAVFGG